MNSEFYKMSCPNCGGGIEFPAHGVGELTLCPHCASEIVLICEGPFEASDDPQQVPVRKPEPSANLKPKLRRIQLPKPKPKLDQIPTSGLGKCRVCGKEVSPSAQTCPHCGEHAPAVVKRCPKCNSTRITASEGTHFGFGKAAAGALVLGPLGLLAGLLPTRSTFFKCLDCGEQFM